MNLHGSTCADFSVVAEMSCTAEARHATALLCIAESLGFPPGCDVEERLQQILGQSPSERAVLHVLTHSPCFYASLSFDNAGVGEGFLPYALHASRVSVLCSNSGEPPALPLNSCESKSVPIGATRSKRVGNASLHSCLLILGI